ncbi:hypothetical protein FS320_43040 [Microvirga tunisiensis]|uniref:Uncharacterized protein n=1 Tax=Microvirga tunisiensis TaxID=2108360 RepID=A0A5N7MWX8_9HYPH|nr:hypothetical protein [Microvirga tunisiensis]MPR31457.1 hypothetical protein [Microvirga tunisiensis]
MRAAILNAFKGRCPSVREMAEISDRDWLKAPGIGPAALEEIRSITDAQGCQTACPSSPRLTDAELLDRLERLQEELRWLQDHLEARLLKTARRKPNRQWHKAASAADA